MKTLAPKQPTSGAYRAGWQSGILHDEKIPLHRDNNRKINLGISSDMPLIAAYWRGYKKGKSAPQDFFKPESR